jgi:hypothetical protein
MAESCRSWCRGHLGAPLLAIVFASCATACATVTHHRIADAADDQSDTGVRYLGTSPYLIAYSDGKGGIVTQVTYLPDPAKKMSAKPDTTLADVDSTLEFDRGVLTTSVSKGDATAVPMAIAKAVEAFAPSLLAAMGRAGETKEYTIPAPYIFKIVVDGSDVYFTGGQGDQAIKITLLPQGTKGK